MRMLRESAKRSNAVRQLIHRVRRRKSSCRSSTAGTRRTGSRSFDAQARMPCYNTWSHLLWSLSMISRSRRIGGMPWLSSSLWNFCNEKSSPCCALVIVAQFQDLQFAERVIEITGIERGAHRFLPGRFLLVVTIVLEELRRLVNRHVLRVHFDGHTEPAQTQHRFVRLRHAIFCGAFHIVFGWSRACRDRRSLRRSSFFRSNAPSLR